MTKITDSQLTKDIQQYFSDGGGPSMKAIREYLEAKYTKEAVARERERIKEVANAVLEEHDEGSKSSASSSSQKRKASEAVSEQPSKKLKASSSSVTWSTSSNGEKFLDLGRNKRLSITSFKGVRYVNIREFYNKDGEMLPTKKGIALESKTWDLLKENLDKIDEYLAE
jgi:hypothetical protein